MSLKTVCDECEEICDFGYRRVEGKDYCSACAKSKAFTEAIKPTLCAKCRVGADDKCLKKPCFECSRYLPACTFVERIERRVCIVCSHAKDLELLVHAKCAPDCALCQEIKTEALKEA